METTALWNWSLEELIRYRRTRFPVRLGLPLAVFLTTAGQVTGQLGSPITWLANLALAGGMLFQFRLWDDLADWERDRLHHPERVLVRASSLAPFHFLLLLLFGLNTTGIAILRPITQTVVFLALNGAFYLWYSGAHKFLGGTAAGCISYS